MFYANFVLSKRGPLAKIWLAAHWEKKLTKAQVYETDINSAVESILEPKVKMALRTTGHLLLGIVRIYSRKAKYLLNDCNEAFMKIKLAFRPGVVDLPDEGREANINAITLPEVFHDFDSALPDFTDMDYRQQLTANQSRPEDITLNEEMPSTSMGGGGFFSMDNGFGDETMLDVGMARDQSSALISMGESDFHIRGIDAPEDDDFGGQLDEALLNEGLDDIFPDEPLLRPDDDMEIDGGVGPALSDLESDNEAPVEEVVSTLRKSARQKAKGQSQISMIQSDQTTLLQNEDESYALEPMDTMLTAPTTITTDKLPGVRGKRRRKLIVDDVKAISGEDMKAQLSDASDTLANLDLAPPTKKLMQWKESGSVDKMFANQCLNLTCKRLQKLYSSQIKVVPKTSEKDDELSICSEDELIDQERAMTPQPTLAVIPEEEISRDMHGLEYEAPLSVLGPTVTTEGNLPPISEEMPPSVSPQHQDLDPFSPFAMEQPETPGAPPGPVDSADEDELNADESKLSQMSPSETDKRWNRRTQQVLSQFQKQLKQRDAISFKEFTKTATRKMAAQKFYTLLVLKKWQCIEISQECPYADILIEAGKDMPVVTSS